MTIRTATIEDLPRMEAAAQEFYASSRFLKRFDQDRFTTIWTELLTNGTGAIFILEDGDEIAGALGAVTYWEPYSGERIAMEFFWFVRQESRGGGLRLYHAYEAWAREMQCSEIRMCHLLDSMPEKLERVYRRLGFEPAEIHYVRGL